MSRSVRFKGVNRLRKMNEKGVCLKSHSKLNSAESAYHKPVFIAKFYSQYTRFIEHALLFENFDKRSSSGQYKTIRTCCLKIRCVTKPHSLLE